MSQISIPTYSSKDISRTILDNVSDGGCRSEDGSEDGMPLYAMQVSDLSKMKDF